MSEKRLADETVRALMHVGASGSMDSFKGADPPEGSVARGVPWAEWVELARSLPPDDILVLTKGLYLVSSADPRWYGGSVTPMKALLGELDRLGRVEAIVEFAAWRQSQPSRLYVGEFGWAEAFSRSGTDWASGTPDEIRHAISRFREESRLTTLRQDEQRAAARARVERQLQVKKLIWTGSARSRARAYSIQLSQQRLGRAVQVAEVATLLMASPVERLEHIASRRDRTLMFWPAKFCEVEDHDLAQMDPLLRHRLFLAGRQVRGGKWKHLQKRLADLDLIDWAQVLEQANDEELALG